GYALGQVGVVDRVAPLDPQVRQAQGDQYTREREVQDVVMPLGERESRHQRGRQKQERSRVEREEEAAEPRRDRVPADLLPGEEVGQGEDGEMRGQEAQADPEI